MKSQFSNFIAPSREVGGALLVSFPPRQAFRRAAHAGRGEKAFLFGVALGEKIKTGPYETFLPLLAGRSTAVGVCQPNGWNISIKPCTKPPACLGKLGWAKANGNKSRKTDTSLACLRGTARRRTATSRRASAHCCCSGVRFWRWPCWVCVTDCVCRHDSHGNRTACQHIGQVAQRGRKEESESMYLRLVLVLFFFLHFLLAFRFSCEFSCPSNSEMGWMGKSGRKEAKRGGSVRMRSRERRI